MNSRAQQGLALVILLIVALVSLAGLLYAYKGAVTGRAWDAIADIDPPYKFSRTQQQVSTWEQAEYRNRSTIFRQTPRKRPDPEIMRRLREGITYLPD
jgi:hypothetical protein